MVFAELAAGAVGGFLFLWVISGFSIQVATEDVKEHYVIYGFSLLCAVIAVTVFIRRLGKKQKAGAKPLP